MVARAAQMLPHGGFIMSVRSYIAQDVKVVVDDVRLISMLAVRRRCGYEFELRGRIAELKEDVFSVCLNKALNNAFVVTVAINDGVQLSELLGALDVAMHGTAKKRGRQ
jgi:hypothetical protein